MERSPERSPFAFDREPHFTVDAGAKRLKMSPRYLAERIQSGDLETRFNGRHVLISQHELGRFAATLAEEREASQATEQERAALDRQQEDGRHIARLVGEARTLAERYGYDPTQD